MDPFVGEIRLMPYNFAPRGWALCQGQIMPINRNTALFALLGTQYGGDGKTTFALPDLRGRTYVGAGQGAGLSAYAQGEVTGNESTTLDQTQMPMHIHTVTGNLPANNSAADQSTVSGNFYAKDPSTGTAEPQYSPDPLADVHMAPDIISGMSTAAGSGLPHENRMPLLVLNYCIALEGVFPQRP